MTVFNKTNKIIGIGGEPVLPFGFATVPDSCKNNSAVQRLADEGRIVINPSDGAAHTALEALPANPPPVPEPAAPEEAPPAAEPPAPEAEPLPEPAPTETPGATEKMAASPADKKRAGKS